MRRFGKKEKVKEYYNIISLDEHRRKLIYGKVKEILNELEDDGGEVNLSDLELKTVLFEFYEYYRKKGILFCFEEAMVDHFGDIADDAYDEESVLDLEYLLGELALYELVDSRVEVNPKETKQLIKGIRSKNI